MSSDKPASSQLRLRVFAGPNGSGKSTVIKSIRESQVSERSIDVGVYINADDIARALFEQKFTFETYELTPTGADFFDFATASGLVSEQFTLAELQASVSFEGPVVRLLNQKSLDRVAQLLARYLRGRTLTGTSPFFL